MIVQRFFDLIAGGGIARTAGAFLPNAEAQDARGHEAFERVMRAYAQEFGHRGGRFNRFIDGLNRLPRPAMAFGTLGLFCHAIADPVAFTEYMTALTVVPEPLWYILGAVVGFYFGARELHHRRLTREGMRGHVEALPSVLAAISEISEMKEPDEFSPGSGDTGSDPEIVRRTARGRDRNRALDEMLSPK